MLARWRLPCGLPAGLPETPTGNRPLVPRPAAGRLCFLCVIGFSLVACIVYSLSLMPGNSSGGLFLAASPAKTGE
jgi:hypothetical protein